MTEDKLASVHTFQDEGHMVTMVCGGINGAPTLIAVDIGIAMGLVGTDLAVKTADVALASDDLSTVLDLHDLGQLAIGVIRKNHGMSITASDIGLSATAGGSLPSTLPAIPHNSPPITLADNSSRLVRYQLTLPPGQRP